MPYTNMNPPQVYTCSTSWTFLPPPSPYHPAGSSQCTSPKHPVSCIKPGLVTHFIYDIIHVSMPFSQIIPPSPSLTESNRGRRKEEGSGWGTRVYLWRIHVAIWQNQYNILKLKNKIKYIKKNLQQQQQKSRSFESLQYANVHYTSAKADV